MNLTAGDGFRRPLWQATVISAALGALTLSSVSDVPIKEAGLLTIVAVALFLSHSWLLRWDVLAGLLIAVILFIPIRRFVLPGDLPFQLEPYRLFVTFLVAAWGTSLLIDSRVRLRRTGLESPLFLFLGAAAASVLFNFDYLRSGVQYFDPVTRGVTDGSLDSNVLKAFTFFLSFTLVFYFITSIARTPQKVEMLVKLLVCGGVLMAVLSVVESRTGVNWFDRLPRVLPFLQENYLNDDSNRGGRLRARGPAEHPIALSAALVMLVPLGVYLAVTTRKLRWCVATAALGVGALTAVSRTGVIMLGVVVLVFLLVRPREVKRLWPALPAVLVLVQVASPGTLGALKQSFEPPGGLLAEQSVLYSGQQGGGRLADIAPSLAEWWERPLVGQGFGTRVTTYDASTGQLSNAIILDNQWLGTLLETGLVGAAALAWLIVRFLRKMLSEARRDHSSRGWLLGALSASVAGLAVGMFVFDALSFIQVAFLFFILMGLGVVTVRNDAPMLRIVDT